MLPRRAAVVLPRPGSAENGLHGLIELVWILSLRIKIAQKPYVVWPLGPKALIYESLDP